MTFSVALASIRQGDLSAAAAWGLIAPVVDEADPKTAELLCGALRAWTWKALDRRRRDPELREWIDVMSRVEAFLVERDPNSATKVALLGELLHESLAVADLAMCDFPARSHARSLLLALRERRESWVVGDDVARRTGLKPANMTRLASLLVDAGLVEQAFMGGGTAYRITWDGLGQADGLPEAPGLEP